MTTHYHFVVETPEPDLDRGMHFVNGTYAQRFNKRYGRTGHVFGGRYASALIETEAHALEVARYVELNPVRAGLCVSAADWRWSSYPAKVGLAPPPRFLAVEAALAYFGGARDVRRARQRYAEFVADGLNPQPPSRGLAP